MSDSASPRLRGENFVRPRRWPRALLLLFLSFLSHAAPLRADDPARVADGAAITPEFARALFDQVRILREPDGCRLVQFNTERFRIAIGLETATGAQHVFGLSSARPSAGARRAGEWTLAVPPELTRDCAQTLAAIEALLGVTAAPRATFALSAAPSWLHEMLGGLFVMLALGTIVVLWREARARRPAGAPLLALVVVSLVALVLRLTLSPRTFLHEYYHIAETVPAYFDGDMPLYGKTGPALFRLVAAATGGGQNVQVIFLTNAVLSALAIPALALFDLAVLGRWSHALCAAVLLCVLPLHLRFSAAEDLYVMALTFGLWSLALFALYLRSGRVMDALLCALALALAMQTRPEMLPFPGVLAALVLLVQPRSWRVLLRWRTLLALALVAVLLVPRALELTQVLGQGSSPSSVPDLRRYLNRLMLLQADVTPRIYWAALAFGLVWMVKRAPGLAAWSVLVFVGYTVAALTLFDNAPYNLRSQILPTSILMLVAAGVAPGWTAIWGRGQRSVAWGVAALAAGAVCVLLVSRGFVTDLRDQQLEWAFLERTVPRLPQRATLLTTIEVGGNNLNAFPQFLLAAAEKSYTLVDIRRTVKGEVNWPDPGGDAIFYQGMFCFFSLEPNARLEPMTDLCQAVHTRYTLEPMFEETLNVPGYSHAYYAPPPYRIGFFRLRAPRT